jgi:hypothetical protein
LGLHASTAHGPVSHDESLLYEEAKETNTVIAAAEVDEAMGHRYRARLRKDTARAVRNGNWQPRAGNSLTPNYKDYRVDYKA